MSLVERRKEFNQYVWDHAADAFQMSFDERRELSLEEITFLTSIHESTLISDDTAAIDRIQTLLTLNQMHFAILLQIVGLTRNKIISDLRGSREAARLGIVVPSAFTSIPRSSAWTLSGPYLLKRLRAVFGLVNPTVPTTNQIYQALNQSTWPGFIRQERAKRSGHEAEYRLATLLFSLKIPFSPLEKAENPLCRDAIIDGISFDIVVPGLSRPRVVFKATVHTANIGQYGESKDHLEVDEARRWLDALPKSKRPILVALIDGVGFRSNSAGLNGVLSKADEFCQFRTIWKAVIVAASAQKMQCDVYLPRTTLLEFTPFIRRYGFEANCHVRENADDMVGLIEAGEALIRSST